MKPVKCPVGVILSCRTPFQLYAAHRYAKLALRARGLGPDSGPGKVFYEALKLKSRALGVVISVLLFVGCGPRAQQMNYEKRLSQSAIFCANAIQTEELRKYCVIGYMAGCTPAYCEPTR